MITHKKLWLLGGVFVALAVVFTGIFMFHPEWLGIYEAETEMEYETKLFDKDQVMTVDIAVDEDEWTECLENAVAEEYISCDITINGETIYNVGIRPKGNTSLTFVANDPDTDRFSFKVEFDHYVTGQNCYGLDKLALNNIYADATYLKEFFSYDIMEYLGVDVPLYSFANITLNGEPWGLYLAVETLEESYAERNFGSSYGQLYKPETTEMGGGQKDQKANNAQLPDKPTNQMVAAEAGDQNPAGQELTNPGETAETTAQTTAQTGEAAPDVTADGRPTEKPDTKPSMKPEAGGGGMGGSKNGADLVYIDDDPDSYSSIFDNAVFDITASDKERLVKALQKLNAGEDLEDCVDVDAVLRYLASNTFLVNLDSYQSSMAHNYYLYEENGQLTMLPWDYNLAFGGFQAGSASSAINFPIDTPVSGVDLAERPIFAKLLEVEEYKEQYHQYLDELINGYFDSGYFEETLEKMDALIRDYVKNDATAFFTFDEYEVAVDMLKQFCLKRAESVKGQLTGEVPSTEEDQKAAPQKLISADGITISVMGMQGGGGDRGQTTKTSAVGGAKTDAGQTEPADVPANAQTGNAGGTTSDASSTGEQNGGGPPALPPGDPGNTSVPPPPDQTTDKADLADGAQQEGQEKATDAEQQNNGNRGMGGGGGQRNGAPTGSMQSQYSNQNNWLLVLGPLGVLVIAAVAVAFYKRKG